VSQSCELSNRRSLRAFFGYGHLVLVAEGDFPTPGFYADFYELPIEIFPPQFALHRCPRPGVWPRVITPFVYAETFRFPSGVEQITIHHADGSDQVPIEDFGPLATFGSVLATDADDDEVALGLSPNLSFDEAFADALTKLPVRIDPPHPDSMANVRVLEIGGLFGGLPGFRHLYVRVRRTFD
jgi:hypothetical protein